MRTILLEGPGLNCLSTPLMTDLERQLDAAVGEPLLLKGAGRAFSAGLDLREVTSLDLAGLQGFLEQLERVTSRLWSWPAPVVAWVNGHAIAGGCIVELTADLRLGSPHPKVRIGLNEVALGLVFPPGILAMLRHRLPPAGLTEAVLGAQLLSPRDAVRVGLLDGLVDSEDEAVARLEQLAAHPREGFARTKAQLRPRLSTPEDWQRYVATDLARWAGPEARERLLAVLR